MNKDLGEKIDKDMSFLAYAYQDDPDTLRDLQVRLNRIEELAKAKDFQNHPCTKLIREHALKEIKRISHKLSFEEDIPVETRRQLFADRKAHITYLRWTSVNYEAEMEAIARSLSEKVAATKEVI